MADILICEDNDQMRQLIVTILRRRGHEVRATAHGQAALDELAAAAPDLAILDVHVPGIGGLTVLARIRADPALAGIRVLLLSGVVEALDDGWGVGAGADGHLGKPFAVDALEAAVGALLQP